MKMLKSSMTEQFVSELKKENEELKQRVRELESAYDYEAAVKSDVIDAIRFRYLDEAKGMGRDEFAEMLNDALWTFDTVTGNGSGSYTFNTYVAERYLCHNVELLTDALNEFGCGLDYLKKGAEACDVTIRCYLLSGAIDEAISELEREGELEFAE